VVATSNVPARMDVATECHRRVILIRDKKTNGDINGGKKAAFMLLFSLYFLFFSFFIECAAWRCSGERQLTPLWSTSDTRLAADVKAPGGHGPGAAWSDRSGRP